jgi:DNA-binding response OmpR family regulator
VSRSARLLLVEDDRFLRRACAASLRQRGFDVVEAVDGEEALRLVRAETFALVLLDMLMPKVGGLDVLRALRAEEATVALPVLILSNSSREQDLAEARQLGIVGYFVKADLSLRALGDLVAEQLEQIS